MDVTHIPAFGKNKFIHVTIDTFSGFLFATSQAGEATKNVIAQVLSCLSVMPQPKIIKTDNRPGYTSQAFKQFCAHLQIKHITVFLTTHKDRVWSREVIKHLKG